MSLPRICYLFNYYIGVKTSQELVNNENTLNSLFVELTNIIISSFHCSMNLIMNDFSFNSS